MPIRVDVPGYGVTEFDDEKQAEAYFQNEKAQRAADQGYTVPEYEALEQKSRDAYEARRKVKKEKDFGDYAKAAVKGIANQPILRKFTEGATAGLSEPVAAGISTLIRKGMGDDASLGDVYSDVAGDQREDIAKIEKKNPGQALLGEVLGVAAPGGAYSRLFGGAGKASELANFAGPGSSLMRRVGSKAVGAGLRGGLANLGYGALNEASSEALGQDEKWKPAMDFLLGAAGDVLALPAEEALKHFSKASSVKKAAESIPGLGNWLKSGREDAEKAAKDVFENAKETYRAGEKERLFKAEADSIEGKRKSVEDFKSLIGKDPTTAAQNFFSKLQKADTRLGKEYGDAIDPIMSRYRLKKIDATPFKAEVDDILGRFGVIDESGKLDLEAMDGFLDFDPDSKALVGKLANFRNSLADETSIAKIERGVRALQKAANFQKGVGYRSATEETVGELSRRLKDFMTDQISTFASPEEVAKIQGAKAKFSEGKKILKEPLKLVGRYGARPERIAVNLRSQVPASAMQDLAKLDPSMNEEFSDLFLNFLTQSSTSPRKFTKEIDYFGPSSGEQRSRDILKGILGEEKFAQLEGAEKNLHEAAVPWKKKYVPEAPPQLKDVPPGELDELYQTLSQWAQSPKNARKKLGAESMPPILSILAPFLSQTLLKKRESFDPITVNP